MKRVFALTSPADTTGSVRQFELALPALRDEFAVTVEHLPDGLSALRSAFTAGTVDLVHTLGAEAFRVVRKLAFANTRPGGVRFPRWLAAGAVSDEPLLALTPGLTATVTQSEYESDWAARLLPAPKQFSLPVAVAHPQASPPVEGLPPGPFVLAAGGFDAVANLKHAVWAFDVLKYAHPHLHLVLLGDGPLRRDVEQFARQLGFDDLRVRCLGFRQDVESYLSRAEQVWGTHTRGGGKFLLEAMAAGVPVIAGRTVESEAITSHGHHGVLVAIDRAVELAKAAHRLLSNPEEVRALVVAGEAATAGDSVAGLARAYRGVYHSLTLSVPPRQE